MQNSYERIEKTAYSEHPLLNILNLNGTGWLLKTTANEIFIKNLRVS